MRLFSITAISLLLSAAALPSFAADDMGMAMKSSKPAASTAGYHFQLAGPAKSSGGKSVVAVQLLHDGKPVPGAIIFQSRADMGPMNMAGMTAPIKPLGEKPAGIYNFEISNGPVWNKPDNWALSFGAKVQGEAQTVTGSVTIALKP